MPSQTEIVQYSLDMINSSPINDLDANDGKSQKCKRMFNVVLDILLAKDEWAFAEGRVSIAVDAGVTPANEWTYQYTLPADCIKPQRINDNDAAIWEVNGNKILTDEASPIVLEYVKRVTDPNLWSAGFTETFTAYLASRYAKAFPQDNDKSGREFAEYQNALNEARAQNGQTGPVQRPTVTELTSGRRF